VSILPKSDPRALGLRFSPPAFLLGLLAASLQVFLLREFSAHFYGNELTFGLVLAGWLFWGGIGSLRASKNVQSGAGLSRLLEFVLLAAPAGFATLRFSRFILGVLPGEMTGLGPVFAFAFALTAALNYPLGRMFVSAVRLAGSVAHAYFWESLGAAAGGGLTYLILIPYLSNWQAVACLGTAAAVAAMLVFGLRPFRTGLVIALLFYASMFVFDTTSQRIIWTPYHLIATKDSLYGKVQVVRTAEQITFYDNGLKVSSSPDPAAAEEAVHFALLQDPGARRVLIVGGATGGILSQALKYPETVIDYIDLDPVVLKLAETTLAPLDLRAIHDPRVRLHFSDARLFLDRSSDLYDVIILDLPEPATAQVNRFYTREFFRTVRLRLSPGGIFSFRVPSAENYIGPDLQRFLAMMRATLRDAFSEVAVVPGETAVFLASTRALDISIEYLDRTLRQERVATVYMSPELLRARLHPLRLQALARSLDSGAREMNTDAHPVSYYFNAVLWSTQFRGMDAAVLRFLGKIPRLALAGAPLLGLLFILCVAGLRPGRGLRPALPMAILGLTTMALEVATLIWFQTRYGNVYRQVALLLTMFMAGLAAGALAAIRQKTPRLAHLIAWQAGFVGLIVIAIPGISLRPPVALPFAFLFVLGYIGGNFFVVANTLFYEGASEAGLGYGWDLIGSFLAAVGLSAVFIPLVGLPVLCGSLLVLNAAVLAGLVKRRPQDKGPRPTEHISGPGALSA
jgi:spermidine synthase